MAAINNVVKYLTPPIPNVSPDYDGVEYRWKFLTFRPACTSYGVDLGAYSDTSNLYLCRLQKRDVLHRGGCIVSGPLLYRKEDE